MELLSSQVYGFQRDLFSLNPPSSTPSQAYDFRKGLFSLDLRSPKKGWNLQQDPLSAHHQSSTRKGFQLVMRRKGDPRRPCEKARAERGDQITAIIIASYCDTYVKGSTDSS